MLTIRILLQIIFLKAKPSDAPFSINATTIAFASAWLSGVWLLALIPSDIKIDPFLFSLLKVSTIAIMLWLFLKAHKKSERFHQTLLSSFGTLAIIHVTIFIAFMLGIAIIIPIARIWEFVIQAYVIKHSLNTSNSKAFFMTFGIQACIALALITFFPEQFQEILEQMQELQSQANPPK